VAVGDPVDIVGLNSELHDEAGVVSW